MVSSRPPQTADPASSNPAKTPGTPDARAPDPVSEKAGPEDTRPPTDSALEPDGDVTRPHQQARATGDAHPPPAKISHYRVERPLGSGGMGEVFEAVDERLDRRVAIKLISRELSRAPEARARFWREARILAAIDHPGVVTIHELGDTEEGDLFIVMELVDGVSLDVRLSAPWPEERACFLVKEVAEAVGQGHRAGITHRDIKPANILLEKTGRIRVVDFGIARRHEESSDRLTVTGMVVGTPAYMSPEQVEARVSVPASDVFTLGILLYRLLSGVSPFERGTNISTAVAISKAEYMPLQALRPDLSPEISQIVERCLALDPEERYPDGMALARALGSLMADKGFSSDMEEFAAFHASMDTDTATLIRRDISAPGSKGVALAALKTTNRMGLLLAGGFVLVVCLALAGYLLYFREPGTLSTGHPAGNAEILEEDAPEALPIRLPPRPIIAVLGFSIKTKDPVDLEHAGVLADLIRVRLDPVPEKLLSVRARTLRGMGIPSPLPDTPIDLSPLTRPNRSPGHIDVVLIGDIEHKERQYTVTSTLIDTRSSSTLASWRVRGPADQPIVIAEAIAHRLLTLFGISAEEQGAFSSVAITRSPEAYAAYLAAQEAIYLNDLSGATERLDWALQLDPEFTLADTSALHVARAERRFEELVTRGQAVLESGSRTPPRELALTRALVAYGEGNPREAVQLFHAVLRRWPYDTDAYLYLMVLRMNEGETVDLAETEKLARHMLEIQPRQEIAASRLVRSLAWRGQAEEAEKALETIGITREDNRFTINPWAEVDLFRGRYAEAIRLFERTLERYDDNIFALHMIMVAQILEGQCVEAADRALNRIRRIETIGSDANLTWTYSVAFQALLCREAWPEAEELLKRWNTRWGLSTLKRVEFRARIALLKGVPPAEVAATVSQTLKKTPESDVATGPLLGLLAQCSPDAKVLRAASKRADTLASRIDLSAAQRAEFRRAQKYLEAAALLRKGDFDEAIAAFEQLVFPWSEVQGEGGLGARVAMMAHLARALEVAGRKQQAYEVWSQIVHLGYERIWETGEWIEAKRREAALRE